MVSSVSFPRLLVRFRTWGLFVQYFREFLLTFSVGDLLALPLWASGRTSTGNPGLYEHADLCFSPPDRWGLLYLLPPSFFLSAGLRPPGELCGISFFGVVPVHSMAFLTLLPMVLGSISCLRVLSDPCLHRFLTLSRTACGLRAYLTPEVSEETPEVEKVFCARSRSPVPPFRLPVRRPEGSPDTELLLRDPRTVRGRSGQTDE